MPRLLRSAYLLRRDVFHGTTVVSRQMSVCPLRCGLPSERCCHRAHLQYRAAEGIVAPASGVFAWGGTTVQHAIFLAAKSASPRGGRCAWQTSRLPCFTNVCKYSTLDTSDSAVSPALPRGGREPEFQESAQVVAAYEEPSSERLSAYPWVCVRVGMTPRI